MASTMLFHRKEGIVYQFPPSRENGGHREDRGQSPECEVRQSMGQINWEKKFISVGIKCNEKIGTK